MYINGATKPTATFNCHCAKKKPLLKANSLRDSLLCTYTMCVLIFSGKVENILRYLAVGLT